MSEPQYGEFTVTRVGETKNYAKYESKGSDHIISVYVSKNFTATQLKLELKETKE